MQALANRYGSMLWIATFVFCLFSAGHPVAAQTGSAGSITVLVQDPSGAVIPDAALELPDRATNDVQQRINSAEWRLHISIFPSDGINSPLPQRVFQRES